MAGGFDTNIGTSISSLLADVYRRCGYASSPDATTSTRILAFMNETLQELLAEPGMHVLLNDSLTITTTASTPQYSIPFSVGRILRVYDATNQILLQPASREWYRSAYPSATAVTGVPDRWIDMGFQAVAKQPSDASQIFAKSTSAVDCTLNIYGYRADGSPFIDGIGPVTTTAAGSVLTDIVEITEITTDSGAVGTITVTEDSGSGTTLATLRPNQGATRYRSLAFAICPSSAITYTLDVEREVRDLLSSVESLQTPPILPVRFHRLLAIGARMKEYEKQNQMDRYRAAQVEYEIGKRKLRHYVYSQAVGTPNLRGNTQPTRGSRLGAWYAEDRW